MNYMTVKRLSKQSKANIESEKMLVAAGIRVTHRQVETLTWIRVYMRSPMTRLIDVAASLDNSNVDKIIRRFVSAGLVRIVDRNIEFVGVQ